MSEVDAVEDMPIKMQQAQAQAQASASKQQQQGAGVSGDDVNVCYKGRTVAPSGPPTPKGWYPMVPFSEDRLWRGSRIAPFGANMAVVLYRAKAGADRWVLGQWLAWAWVIWGARPMAVYMSWQSVQGQGNKVLGGNMVFFGGEKE